MGRINIKDSKTIINNANSVFSSLTEIKNLKTNIENILNELDSYWENNGDRQKFAKILSSELSTLGDILYCTDEFCAAISDYVNAQEATSSNVAPGR